MSRRNYFQEPQQIEPFNGMDTTSPIQLLKPGFVVSAKNCYPGLEGGAVKRDGYATVLNSAWGSRSITGGIEYKTPGGSRLPIIYGTDGTASGGIIAYVQSGSPTNIATSLSGTARPSFVQFDNQLYFFNGSDAPVVYDGTTTKQMGITPPAAAPTAVLAGGGSLNTNSNYIWAYTYYNSTTLAESSPSALSATTAMGANTKSTLTLLAGSSATADTIRIWRTYANGQQLFLDGTAAIGATSYVSTIADAALGIAMETDNTRLTTWSSTPSFPIVADKRIFVRTGKNEVRYSKMGQSGPMQESFEVRAVCDTTGLYGNNDDVIGLSKAGDVPIVLKERSIGRLDSIGFPDLSLSTDYVIYTYKEISAQVCAVSHFAAVDVLGECIFLGRDNIYGTRGQEGDLRAVADPIQATIRGLGFSSSQVTKVSGINDTKNKLVKFQVFLNAAASQPAYMLVGDYRAYPHFRWTWYTPGTDTSTHPGYRAACLFQVTNSTDGTQNIYAGNTDLNGLLYQLDSGTTDNGSGIYYEIITRPYGGEYLFSEKLYKTAGIYCYGDGTTYSITVSAIYDMSGAEENAQSFSLSSGGALWDTATWDVSTWPSLAVPLREYETHRKAKHQQLVIRQTSASAPLTLYSWATSGSLFKPF